MTVDSSARVGKHQCGGEEEGPEMLWVGGVVLGFGVTSSSAG